MFVLVPKHHSYHQQPYQKKTQLKKTFSISWFLKKIFILLVINSSLSPSLKKFLSPPLLCSTFITWLYQVHKIEDIPNSLKNKTHLNLRCGMNSNFFLHNIVQLHDADCFQFYFGVYGKFLMNLKVLPLIFIAVYEYILIPVYLQEIFLNFASWHHSNL